MTDLSLPQLHKQLRSLEKGNCDRIKAIQGSIRAHLPDVNTVRALPHKKTPSGRTRVLHMNYMRSQTDSSGMIELDYLRFFAKTIQTLGIRLEIVTDKDCREEILEEFSQDSYRTLDYGLSITQNPVSKWAEDSVEYLEDGQMAVLQTFDNELLEWAMTTGRRERWQGKVTPEQLEEILRDDHLWIVLGVRVNELETGLELAQTARAKGEYVGHIRAYIEGGNMITGEDAAGKSITLVGKDAISTTAHLYQLSNDDVRQIIAEDFGLDTIESVICVEQPGKFHLDMGLLFVGNGMVIVNDSSAALADALEMAELVPSLTAQTMVIKRELQCRLENDAARDLQLAGLDVRRETLENDVFYNFFNGEFVEGADGHTYYITNGGLKEQEDALEDLLVKELGVVEKIFFTPQALAQKSLQEQGGVGCRLKGVGA
ncbi:MAG: hypothetical protein AAF821_09115 [Cyanobacteria bacterium P01_D01_bin.156]